MPERSYSEMAAHPASFRDPDGYVFLQGGEAYRRVRSSYAESYALLMKSGCYAACVEKGLLIPHEDVTSRFAVPEDEMVLRPEQIACVTYPYEWSFLQWQAAALCTLDVLRLALEHGLILKDASAFNTTWHKGRMVFLDTLSFAPYQEGEPWAGYRQFCSHFLAPLALMRYTDVRCNALFLHYLDGIPLDLAAKLLPWRTKFMPSLLLHLHAHAALQCRKAGSAHKMRVQVSKKTLFNLTDSLRHAVSGLVPPKVRTEWGDYYSDTNYGAVQRDEKHSIILEWLRELSPHRVLDLGSNDGTYSLLAAQIAEMVISADIDPVAVNKNARRCLDEKNGRIIPLLLDMTAPTPAVGWHGRERSSVIDRMQADCGLALALVHHMVIGNNVPLLAFFELLRDLAPTWIVEFPDKEDSQVQRLLRNRKDVFPTYTPSGFEEAAQHHFDIIGSKSLTNAHRTLILLRTKESV